MVNSTDSVLLSDLRSLNNKNNLKWIDTSEN